MRDPNDADWARSAVQGPGARPRTLASEEVESKRTWFGIRLEGQGVDWCAHSTTMKSIRPPPTLRSGMACFRTTTRPNYDGLHTHEQRTVAGKSLLMEWSSESISPLYKKSGIKRMFGSEFETYITRVLSMSVRVLPVIVWLSRRPETPDASAQGRRRWYTFYVYFLWSASVPSMLTECL